MWKTIDSEVIHDGSPFLILTKQSVQDDKGNIISPWYKIYDSDFVVVVPITTDNEIVFVQQYRQGVERMSLELPSGGLKPEESWEKTARRELLEETGYNAPSFVDIFHPLAEDASLKSNYFKVYIAPHAQKVSSQNLDPTEDIEVVKKPVNEINKLIFSGEVFSTPSVMGLLLANLFLHEKI